MISEMSPHGMLQGKRSNALPSCPGASLGFPVHAAGSTASWHGLSALPRTTWGCDRPCPASPVPLPQTISLGHAAPHAGLRHQLDFSLQPPGLPPRLPNQPFSSDLFPSQFLHHLLLPSPGSGHTVRRHRYTVSSSPSMSHPML